MSNSQQQVSNVYQPGNNQQNNNYIQQQNIQQPKYHNQPSRDSYMRGHNQIAEKNINNSQKDIKGGKSENIRISSANSGSHYNQKYDEYGEIEKKQSKKQLKNEYEYAFQSRPKVRPEYK